MAGIFHRMDSFKVEAVIIEKIIAHRKMHARVEFSGILLNLKDYYDLVEGYPENPDIEAIEGKPKKFRGLTIYRTMDKTEPRLII